MNATVPDEPLVPDEPPSQATTRRLSSREFSSSKTNATVPGVGSVPPRRNETAPMPLPLPVPRPPNAGPSGPTSAARRNDVVVPAAPASDPFVADAITAPASGGGTQPMGVVPMQAPPAPATAPDLDDLVRSIEQDSTLQTPVVHAAESRGRDGVMHVAVVQPAHGHVTRPLEPLVVVEVSTDPTARNITSIVEPRPAQSWPTPTAPRQNKGATIALVCIFGACLIVAVGIGSMLLGRYHASADGTANPAVSAASPASSPVQPPAVVAAPIPTPPVVAAPAAPPQAQVAPAPVAPADSAAGTAAAGTASESAPASTHHAGSHSTARPHAPPAHSGSATHAEELEHGID